MEKKEFIIRLCNLLWRYFIKCCHELSLGSSRAIFLANDLWTTQITTSSSSSSICGRGDRGSGHLLPRRLSKPSSLYLQLFSAPSCHFLSRAVRRAARAVCVCVGVGYVGKKRLKLALWSADSCRIPSAYRADSINSLTGTGWKKVVKKVVEKKRVTPFALAELPTLCTKCLPVVKVLKLIVLKAEHVQRNQESGTFHLICRRTDGKT